MAVIEELMVVPTAWIWVPPVAPKYAYVAVAADAGTGVVIAPRRTVAAPTARIRNLDFTSDSLA
jgi:hypothetical protein